MRRERLEHLMGWKNSKNRKPLILRGARQVGKTWLIRELGKTFDYFVEVNLEQNSELIPYFVEHKGDPEKLIQKLNASLNCSIRPRETLLFIDEIQECREALASLRYFKEKIPDLHVIAAGSLIEFALKDLSFPVGRVDFMHLFPMNFSEYLLAAQKESYHEIVQDKPVALDKVIHKKIMNEFKTYTLLGGMPAVIATYLSGGGELSAAQSEQQSLVAAYRNDFNKYATRAQAQYVKIVFDSIPKQFGSKFVYSRVSSDLKTRDLGMGMNLLVDAQLAYKCHHSSGNNVPLGAEIKENKFKVFFVDTGLAHRILGYQLNKLYLEEFIQFGGVCENIVAQELLSRTSTNSNPLIYYWHREEKSSTAEVDLLVEKNDEIIPIEIKRGSDGRKKSLSIFCEEKKKKTAYIVTDDLYSKMAINSKKTNLICLPYYFVSSFLS